jgi:hypothetical protein
MSQARMNIYVRIPSTGKSLTLAVGRENTVSDVKNLISAEENIHPQYQRLLFSGTLLDDESAKLSDLNINAESTITLALRVDSGHEVSARFTGLQTIPQVFEQIVIVKEKNEELYAQIQAVVEVKKLSYFAEYVVDEDGVPSFRAVEEEEKVAASAIIDEFALECDFHRVKDYFKDRINYDITTVAELVDMNQALIAVHRAPIQKIGQWLLLASLILSEPLVDDIAELGIYYNSAVFKQRKSCSFEHQSLGAHVLKLSSHRCCVDIQVGLLADIVC